MVGLDNSDDAGVYRLNDDTALIQTVDFITPVVDNPYRFGQIAAANSLSDVYAMGGKPLTALNILGFPAGKLDHRIVIEILRGGADKVAEAGAVLLGGHTVDDPEPKYGLAVTGVAHPDAVWTNTGARPGDSLILSKPIGVGVLTTAIKRNAVSPDEAQIALESMAALNDRAAAAGREVGLSACTDISGFGLLGHLSEVTRASGVGAVIFSERVPVLPGARRFAAEGFFPGGSKANARHFSQFVKFEVDLPAEEKLLFYDAVTSGGLLMSVRSSAAAKLVELLRDSGTPSWDIIGEVVEDDECKVRVVGGGR